MTEHKSYWSTHNAVLRKDGTWEEYEIDERGRRLPLNWFNRMVDKVLGR